MSKPLFSVITPVYNREHLVTKALDSVKAQTYRPIELVLVDDGSSDNSVSVMQQWARANEEPGQFTVLVLQQENAGPSAARNRGFRASKGQYIQFLDSDDLLYSSRLEKLAEVFLSKQADYLYTSFDVVDGDQVVRENVFRPTQESILERTCRRELWHLTLASVFRRDLLEKTSLWPEDMRNGEDTFLIHNCIVLAQNPVGVEEKLAALRRGGDDHLSSRMKLRHGQESRVRCELSLTQATMDRPDIRDSVKVHMNSRLLSIACQMAASGWPDLARQCRQEAQRHPQYLKRGSWLKILASQLGKPGGELICRLKSLR